MFEIDRKKFPHDKTTMKKKLKFVRELNRKFNRNFFTGDPMKPFKLYWLKTMEWRITCNDHYTWSDNLEFKRLKSQSNERFAFESSGEILKNRIFKVR